MFEKYVEKICLFGELTFSSWTKISEQFPGRKNRTNIFPSGSAHFVRSRLLWRIGSVFSVIELPCYFCSTRLSACFVLYPV